MRSSGMMGERPNHSGRNSTAGLNADTVDTPNNPDRRVSVRSIMTLPAYSEDAKPSEKVIAREGERAGVDTVIEYPETGEEEESRREEEMQSLYQIREARRNERAEREERRRLRREARSRGDRNTLEELRLQARLRAGSGTSLNGTESTAAALMQEHASRDRGRRISSVSYADLGVARHDGSRVRGGSNDSNRPLIEGAPSFEGRRGSGPNSPLGRHMYGHQSTSSLRFVTQDISDDEGAGSDLEYVPTPPWGSRRPSASNLREGPDLGSGRIPHPPAYEEASRSSTPVLGQQPTEAPRHQLRDSVTAPQLPAFAPLPDIDLSGLARAEAAAADEQDRRWS
ncbi:MAG: hypothetical protein M1831_003666 [Alyxoria varia]|nr:MAG: hypothetical protein M1831_003666 [Alyxoria varia]